MPRALTAAAQAAAEAQRSEIIHLLELNFSAGAVRFTTGPHNVSWNAVTWFASGSAMTFEAVAETGDVAGQRLRLTLDGVDLQVIAALLAQEYIGRLGRLYRAHFDAHGKIVADPILLFVGYMNAPWEVAEDPEKGWAKVETDLASPLAVGDQVRGITADENSHQQFFPGDTFFSHIVTKPHGDFGWGPGDPNASPLTRRPPPHS